MTWPQVLTDRIPYYEYNDCAAMVHIIRGEPPKKPIFFITRGYTQKLWDMTISCWDAEPSKRPTVDQVLGALTIAAKRWKPRCGGFSNQDDCDQTASEEESDPPTDLEPEDEPVDDTPGSPDPPQPLAIETPVPALPSASSSSTVMNPTQLESTPTTSREETKSAPAIPPQEEQEPRPRTVIPGKEEMEPEPVRLSREVGHGRIPAPPGDADIQVMPIVPPKQEEKFKLGPVTFEDEVARPAPDRQSREELSLTLDDTADQILAKLKLPLGENEARAVVEALEKVSRRHAQTTCRRV